MVTGFRERLPVGGEVLTFFFVPGVPRVLVPSRVVRRQSCCRPRRGWPPEAGGVRMHAVRVTDLRSPLRRPLREGDRTALTVAGTGKIRTGDLVVSCKPVASRRRWSAGTGRCRPAVTADHAGSDHRAELDEMTGQPGAIDQVAAQARPQGKVKGTARRSMTMAAARAAVMLMALMPEAGYARDPRRSVRRPAAGALARAVRRADRDGARHLAGRGWPGTGPAPARHGPPGASAAEHEEAPTTAPSVSVTCT